MTGEARNRLQGIEASRGIAALAVVLYHASVVLAPSTDFDAQVFGGFFKFGRAGVDFFFVLSGFIIAYVHTKDIGVPTSVGGYWRKRLLRIYPPYWIATIILGAILIFSPTRDRAERDPLYMLFSMALLPESRDPILGVGWSLRHEMLFYLMFCLLLLNRRAGLVALSIWAAAIVCAALFAMATGRPLVPGIVGEFVLRFFNLQFFLGMAVATLVRSRPGWHPVIVLFCGAGLFFATGMVESFVPGMRAEWAPRELAYGLGAAMILYGTAVLDRARAWNIPAPLLVLGDASYSLYLTHVTVIIVLQFAMRQASSIVHVPLIAAFLICVVSAICAGVVFNRIIERPLLQVGRPRLVAA